MYIRDIKTNENRNQDFTDVTLADMDNSKQINYNQQKCYYYDKGYCKFKDKCEFYHPNIECTNQCKNRRKCRNRHKIECKYGNDCHFLKNTSCEYLHLIIDLPDITLNNEDNGKSKNLLKRNKHSHPLILMRDLKAEAHQVILAAPSTIEEQLNLEFNTFKDKLEEEYKLKIEKFKKDINEYKK